MTITETIAELERQLAAGELSDDDALRLQELHRQLSDAFASERMGDDDNMEDEDGERMGDDEHMEDEDGERAASDDGHAEVEESERAASDDGHAEVEESERAASDDGHAAVEESERGAQDQPTRPERRRAERENRKAAAALTEHFRAAAQRQRSLPQTNPDGARSLTNVNIHPDGRVPRHDSLANLDLGMYFRALSDPNKFRVTAKRELAWMERNLGHGFYRGADDGAFIPYTLLAEHGPRARERAAERALNGISPEKHLESFMAPAERAFQALEEQANGYSERALTTVATSAGAATSSLVDLAHSIMWLTEMDAALEMMTVLPGLQGQWQGFYGNANPVEDYVVEAADITETTPTLTRITRLPKTMGMFWKISTAEVASADTPIAAMIEAGCEAVIRTKVMRAALSGTGVGAAFAVDANAITGLMGSGIDETTIGATIANFDRGDTVAARRRLFASEVDMSGLGWILANDVAQQLESARVGGAESVRFVYEDGMVDCGAEKVPARDSIHLGKTGITGVSVLLQRSAAILLLWGAGIMFNALQIPGKTTVDYDLQVQMNFALMNPKRATATKVG